VNYYILENTDEIRDDDEYICPDDFTWKPIPTWLVGMSKRRAEVKSGTFMEIRRKPILAVG